jgi:uncharacterized protein (UPF0371 family)
MRIKSGFAKFETFPIWNLPLEHPVNIAYEAATADLGDYNKIDPFHKRRYGIEAVNYNRDIENFSLMKKIIDKILGKAGINPRQKLQDLLRTAMIGVIVGDED